MSRSVLTTHFVQCRLVLCMRRLPVDGPSRLRLRQRQAPRRSGANGAAVVADQPAVVIKAELRTYCQIARGHHVHLRAGLAVVARQHAAAVSGERAAEAGLAEAAARHRALLPPRRATHQAPDELLGRDDLEAAARLQQPRRSHHGGVVVRPGVYGHKRVRVRIGRVLGQSGEARSERMRPQRCPLAAVAPQRSPAADDWACH